MWNYFPDMEPVIHENADLMQVLKRLSKNWGWIDLLPESTITKPAPGALLKWYIDSHYGETSE